MEYYWYHNCSRFTRARDHAERCSNIIYDGGAIPEPQHGSDKVSELPRVAQLARGRTASDPGGTPLSARAPAGWRHKAEHVAKRRSRQARELGSSPEPSA